MFYFIKCILIGAMCGVTAYVGFPFAQDNPLKLAALAVALVLAVMNKHRIEPHLQKLAEHVPLLGERKR